MKIFCPASFAELEVILEHAVTDCDGPVAVRYPRGGECGYADLHPERECILRPGDDLTLVAYGTLIGEALKAAALLERQGISAEVIKLSEADGNRFPIVMQSLSRTHRLLAAEEVCAAGCIGEVLSANAAEEGIPLRSVFLNLGELTIIRS